jgi:16S rRNA (guanine527-N7)-methyltransferase
VSASRESTYGPLDFARDSGVARETLSRLSTYVDLLRDWNQRVNLVAESTLADVWRRHIWDSAQLAPLIPPTARTIVDIGSGAGFPGLVLAIMLSGPPPPPLRGRFPPPQAGEVAERSDAGGGQWRVHLIESTQKKCRFLEAVITATAAPAKVHCARAEEVKGLKADVVTARAVAPLDRLLPLAFPFFKPATLGLFLKGRSLNDELTAATKSWRLVPTLIPSRSDPSGFVLRVTGLTPWKARKPS